MEITQQPRLLIQIGQQVPVITTLLIYNGEDRKVCDVTLTVAKGKQTEGKAIYYRPDGEILAEFEGKGVIGPLTSRELVAAWGGDDWMQPILASLLAIADGMASVSVGIVLGLTGDGLGWKREITNLLSRIPGSTVVDETGHVITLESLTQTVNIDTPFKVKDSTPIVVLQDTRFCPCSLTDFSNVSVPDDDTMLEFVRLRVTHFDDGVFFPTSVGAFIGYWRYPWAAVAVMGTDGVTYHLHSDLLVYVHDAGSISPAGMGTVPEAVWRGCGNHDAPDRDDWMTSTEAAAYVQRHVVPSLPIPGGTAN